MRVPQKEAEMIYFYDLVTKIETHNIPHQLVFNMDQTPSKYIQSYRYSMEKSSSKCVAIAASGDKRTITTTFIISLAGNTPFRIYGGKTDKSLPKIDFSKGYSLIVNPKLYEKETQKIINEIILPHVNSAREELINYRLIFQLFKLWRCFKVR